MSLKYVTRKLEDQSLEEEARAVSNLQEATAEEAEDSGTESDDETETEAAEGESEAGDGALDSGVSLNLRSSSQTARHAGRQLPSLVPDSPQTPTTLSTSEPPSLPSSLTSSLPSSLPLDLDDNHSSEEELEDIIGTKKVYTSTPPVGTSTSIKTCTSTNPEKRKWSEVTSSSDETGRASTCVFRAGSGSSGDEEVCGLMEGADGGSYTPVQFCTSPPLDVYKPRKSQSPPPKLFHMSTNGCGHLGGREGLPRQGSLDSATRHREGPGRPSGAFRPRPRSGRPGVVELCSLPSEGAGEGEVGEEGEEASGHRSPNKRHRTTPRPHNIQRPCLDFEKMQQIKTRVVTSWRQGTELSLFCW